MLALRSFMHYGQQKNPATQIILTYVQIVYTVFRILAIINSMLYLRNGYGGDRTHVLRITDLILYLPALWINSVWNKIG